MSNYLTEREIREVLSELLAEWYSKQETWSLKSSYEANYEAKRYSMYIKALLEVEDELIRKMKEDKDAL